MQLYKMDKPQCLLYAAAMVLGESPYNLIQEIGHDGMDVVWPKLSPPMCYRSMHIQEIIDCFVARGFGLMPVEHKPLQAPGEGSTPISTFNNSDERFYHHIEGHDAILIGRKLHSSDYGHAWAWCHKSQTCYDPNGFLSKLSDYIITEAWIKVKMI